jgi:hypothetical protein
VPTLELSFAVIPMDPWSFSARMPIDLIWNGPSVPQSTGRETAIRLRFSHR